MKRFLQILLGITLAAVATSCVKYDTQIGEKEPLSVNGMSFTFEADGGEQLVKGYKSEGSLHVASVTIDGVTISNKDGIETVENSWCRASDDYDSMGIIITILPNDTGEERTGTVLCYNKSIQGGTISVKQKK